MHSLGNSTLSAFLNAESVPVEKPSRVLRSTSKCQQTSATHPPREDESDLEKYFRDSVTFWENGSKRSQSSKRNKSALSLILDTAKQNGKTNHVANNFKCINGDVLEDFKENRNDDRNSSIAKKCKLSKSVRELGRISEGDLNISNINKKKPNVRNHEQQEEVNNKKLNIQNKFNDIRNISSKSINLVSTEKGESIINGSKVDNAPLESMNNGSTRISHQCSNSSLPFRVPTQDQCKLSAWGLPPSILERYESWGVTSMFPWQVECLSNHRVIEDYRNLVYSAPTSAGKTLVAELLMIKTILERQKKVLFILPYVSVVREKMFYFQDLLSNSGVRVEGFMGGLAPPGGFAMTHVAIATIEKANSLINRLMEEGDLYTLGAVVVDELHLLGDPSRGYLLELLLTKLKYMGFRDDRVKVQLIGMSATLPNLSLLARWLDAELYKTDFRPVPLNEHCKIGTTIYNKELQPIKVLTSSPDLSSDPDNIIQLCIETIADGHSVLIFCPTKNWCEKLAHQMAASFFKLGRDNTPIGQILRLQLNYTAITETLEQLKRSPVGLDGVLKNTVSFGVAFHHAGLTMDERDIIEGAFRAGSLRVLAATSTLSSGVNLPARRVIVRSVMFHGKPLDILSYKQMIGRAGRMGKDTEGESILICKSNERQAAEHLLSASLDPIESCLEGSGPLIRALLEAVASEVAFTPADLDLYTKCTLVSLTEDDDVEGPTKEAIQFLVDNEFFLLQGNENGDQRWVATPLGKACLAASIAPRDALFLFEELQKARKCFVLDTELHIVYLVTPFNTGSQIGQIDWMIFFELWKKLSESERRVGHLVGIEERFLMSAIRGTVKPGKPLNIHRRFFTALALHDLVREVPLSKVCERYGCCRGVLQSLQQSAATFAGMVTHFCKQLGWDCVELLVGQFQTRLQFGVCRELLDLLRLPSMNGLRARSLYKEGITTVAELAVADVLDVERVLYKALPFEREKEEEGEHEMEAVKRNKMRTIFVTGREGLTPQLAAILLVHEARTLVQNELGMVNVQWTGREEVSESSEELRDPSNENPVKESSTAQNEIPDKDTSVDITQNNSINDAGNINSNQHDTTEKLPEHQNEINVTKKNSVDTEKSLQDKKEQVTNEIFDEKFDTWEGNEISKCGPRNDVADCLRQSEDNVETGNERNASINVDAVEENQIQDKSSNEEKPCRSLVYVKEKNQLQVENHEISDVRIFDESFSAIKIPTSQLSTPLQKEVNMPLEQDAMFPIINQGIPEDKTSKPSTPYSPSLFGDSLNIDTQAYDILEQNIIGSFDMSTFEMSNLSNPKLVKKDTPKENIKSKSKSPDKKISDPVVNSVLSWNLGQEDDSWNNSKIIADRIFKIDKKLVSGLNKPNAVKDAKPQNVSVNTEEILPTQSFEEEKNHRTKSRTQRTQIVSQKRKYKDLFTGRAAAPITNVITFPHSKRLSIESNKSDSDDMIGPSQGFERNMKVNKNRHCLKLEAMRKIGTVNNEANEAENCQKSKTFLEFKTKVDDIEPEIIPTVFKTPIRRSLTNINYSTDSVVSNSDDDMPTKKSKTFRKLKTTSSIIKSSEVKVETIQNKLEKLQEKGKDNVALSINYTMLDIVNVTTDRAIFKTFKRHIRERSEFALAAACEKVSNITVSIGTRILAVPDSDKKKKSRRSDNYVYGDTKVRGIAISWGRNVIYYIPLYKDHEAKVSVKECMSLLLDVLSTPSMSVRCFAAKEVYKTLHQCCGITPTCKFIDPKTADWMLNSDTYERSFNAMTAEYFPAGLPLMHHAGICYHGTGPGLNINNSLPSEGRSSVEAMCTWHIMDAVLEKLNASSPDIMCSFRDVEMRAVATLARMELTGLGVSLKSLQELLAVLQQETASLEQRSFAMAGRKFNFSSSKDVAQVLGMYKGKKVSTNKVVLEQSDNPIAKLIISWRKLNVTQTKMVLPLISLAQDGSRVHGICVTNTATGRVSMHEPNLQNVPRDFSSEDNSFVISVRMAFVPSMGNVMLSADYCQLELRILAHFSKDPVLCYIMQKDGDVFKSIAAQWNHVTEENVDDTMRQRTKQLCYAMIYGMGSKALAELLTVTELEAKEFLDTFMKTYPTIKTWLHSAVEEARVDGYVTTLMHRRRILPGLYSKDPSEKAQSERQAINTKIQGSAADIAKKAMVTIEERVHQQFPNSLSVLSNTQSKWRLRSNNRESQTKGAYLTLQLHDELLYEVNRDDLEKVAKIVKESMEQVHQLLVPLPVKIKVGPAWGDLTEYKIPEKQGLI
ncbi:DNA polymerase theta [Orussus abietinus]|uniref:DNA polymerase theta n=1 Tax=Orussus abietinus TaxID=222816 RepID=UPI0006257AD1|nr:DNA polymerase theta [Orussus abietinus]